MRPHGVAMLMGGLGAIGQIAAPFTYVPDLGPVGSGSSYFPRDTTEDAKALNFLGFLDDEALRFHPGSMGSQAKDVANEVGAWDPALRAGVTRYEAARKLTIDSWIGPQVRASLAKDVIAKNAAGVPSSPVAPLPPVVIPVDPGNVPQKPNAAPLPGVAAGASAASSTTTIVAAGVGLLAIAAIGYAVLR